ncbi:MAG: tRNA (adenosine(37)-N6)-dimethylallyltransferase MiaA [Parcubacteria group bacterium]|jgi:tRNA dimethylallyltransferase
MESRRHNKIVVILGPTSAGKSAVAVRLAQQISAIGGPAYGWNGAEIVSVDSRQIYRGMDVGTGKVIRDANIKHQAPSTKQDAKYKIQNTKDIFMSEGIPHYMINIVDPQDTFSAAEFKKMTDEIITDILQRGKLPILCGGTGFWIKSIVDNVTYPEVEPNWPLREELGKKTAAELFAQLQVADPTRAASIDAKNPVRLIRALEICAALGSVPQEQSQPQYQALQIGVAVPKETLHAKIKKRLDSRWRDGMLEETKRLHEQGLSWEKIQSFGLGYFWMPEYLQNKIRLEELYEKVYLAEKDYAKRQMTWFAKDHRIMWLEKYIDIEKAVLDFITE